MKKIIFFIIIMSMAVLISCGSNSANDSDTAGEAKTTIEMELGENYDVTDPFVNAKLFCVSEDLSNLAAEGTLEIDGDSGVLEVKNNRTCEALWSGTWEGNVKSETFPISLANIKKDDEYAVYFTGTKINHAVIKITFESDFVQERERPLR